MIGYFAAFLSAVFASSKDLVSKKLSFSVDGTTSGFASFLFAIPYYLICMAALSIVGMKWWLYSGNFVEFVVLRSVTDTVAEITKMYAFMFADISLLACVYAVYPLALLILSPVLTGDPLKIQHVFAIGCIVIGSLIITVRPDTHVLKAQKKGIIFGLISGVFFALNTCFDRLAAQQSSPVFSGFAMTALSMLFILPFMFKKQRGTQLVRHSKGFLLRGFFEAAFMICRLWALQFFSGPFVVVFQKLSFVFSIIGGRIAFKEQDFGRRFFAGLVVLFGVLLMVAFGS